MLLVKVIRKAAVLSLFASILLVLPESLLAAPTNLTWTGADTNWDTSTDGNWTGAATKFVSDGTMDVFFNGAGSVVNISPDMNPKSTTVNASSAYTFNGGPISGSGTLTKSGNGTLTLNGANTFSGGIVLNGGSIALRTSALNNNAITVNGSVTINASLNADTISTGGVTFGGNTLTFALNTTAFTTSGAVTGSGDIILEQAGGGATKLNFNSTANNLTGGIVYRVTAQTGDFTANSFSDSASPGAGNIRFGVNGSVPHTFTYGSGAIVPLTLNNRRFELAAAVGTGSAINNNSSQSFTINSDLLVSATGAKTLTLGGSGSGLGIFAGKIIDSSSTLSLTVGGSWALYGTNTYTGSTKVNGTVYVNSIKNFGVASSFGAASSGEINFDSYGAYSIIYTGAGDTANRTIALPGDVSTRNNNCGVYNDGTGAMVFTGSIFNSQAGGAGGRTTTMILGGNYTGSPNQIQGSIQDNDIPANNNRIAITKTGTGTWTLSGTNTFTGALSVSLGTIQLNGATGSLNANTLTLGSASGGGAFVYDNIGAGGATAQSMGAAASADTWPADNVVQVTRTALQTVSLTLASLNTTSTHKGPTFTFVHAGTPGTIGADSKIVITGCAAGFIDGEPICFFNDGSGNGSTFAWYDASGYIRGINYGVDANTQTYGAQASIAGPANHTRITGNITAQASASIGAYTAGNTGTLEINGANNLTLAAGATLKVLGNSDQAPGILKTGGGTSTISGGTALALGIQGAGVIRTDGLTDQLYIDTPVTSDGKNIRFVKSGAGTLTLRAVNTWNTTFQNDINGGTLEIGGSGAIPDNPIAIASGATFKYNSSTSQSLSGVISGAGGITQVGPGALTLSNGGNSFYGQLTVQAGTLVVPTINNANVNGPLGNSARAVILGYSGGGTGILQYTGATAASTKPFTIATGGYGVFQIDNASATQTITGAISGGGNLVKTGAGTLVLSGPYTQAGDIIITNGVLTVTSTNMSSSATVYVSSPGTLNLDFTGTATINMLYVNGAVRSANIYGSNNVSQITGPGVIRTMFPKPGMLITVR